MYPCWKECRELKCLWRLSTPSQIKKLQCEWLWVPAHSVSLTFCKWRILREKARGFDFRSFSCTRPCHIFMSISSIFLGSLDFLCWDYGFLVFVNITTSTYRSFLSASPFLRVLPPLFPSIFHFFLPACFDFENHSQKETKGYTLLCLHEALFFSCASGYFMSHFRVFICLSPNILRRERMWSSLQFG